MHDKIDNKDQKILEILKQDSSLSTREIAKKTLLPITTVHNRIRKLNKSGVIKRFTIDIDNAKIGKQFSAIILVSCDYKSLRDLKKDQHQLAREISHLEEVENVDIVTGGMDMVVKVRVKDVEEFDTFLLKRFQKMQGVDKTQSLVVIHET